MYSITFVKIFQYTSLFGHLLSVHSLNLVRRWLVNSFASRSKCNNSLLSYRRSLFTGRAFQKVIENRRIFLTLILTYPQWSVSVVPFLTCASSHISGFYQTAWLYRFGFQLNHWNSISKSVTVLEKAHMGGFVHCVVNIRLRENMKLGLTSSAHLDLYAL